MAMYLMENIIQKYDWGDSEFLPAFLGRDNPSREPWAELWMGAHPSAPSLVRVPGAAEPLRLDELVTGDPVAMLGATTASRWRGTLPFMLKAMAVSKPMSIHAHPARVKAERGFRREDSLLIPLDAQDRNFRDLNPKPEIVVAMTRFEGMCGFRSTEEIVENIRLMAPESWRSIAGRLAARPSKLELSVLFYNMISARDARKLQLLRASRARAERVMDGDPDPGVRATFGRMLEFMDAFPDDMGAMSPLILNLFSLEPGQGLYIAPGEPHAYFRGAAVELEASSDNRIRGGLSRKHIDLAEFLSVLTFDTGPLEALSPLPGPGPWQSYPTRSPEFELARARLDGGDAMVCVGPPLPEIVLCAEGSITLIGRGGSLLELARGASAFVPASEAGYSLGGRGCAFRARPGSAS